ncbi:MAG: hypothetical protein ACK4YO_02620, partial [Candidatus Altarchaeaceae archaeon]
RFKITITNSGTCQATDVKVTDVLPSGFTYVNGSTTGMTTSDPNITEQTLRWNTGQNINGLENMSLEFNASVSPNTQAGVYNNTASATSDQGDSTINGSAIITVIALSSNATFLKVCTPTYESGTTSCIIGFIYVGSGDSVENITITDYLPEGFSYVNATNITDINTLASALNIELPQLPSIPGVNLDFSPATPTSPYIWPNCGDSESIQFGTWRMNQIDGTGVVAGFIGLNITLKASSEAGTYTNNATVNYTVNDNNNSANTTATIVVAELLNASDTVIKVCTPLTVLEGGEVNCTITYLHVGFNDVKNITITDYLPEGFRYINATPITNLNDINLSALGGLPSLPGGLEASSLIKLADGPDYTIWPNSCANDTIVKFGEWNITANQTALGKVAIGVVGIRVTLRASSNISDTTQTFQNNATINANETDNSCGYDKVVKSIESNGSGNITVLKANTTDIVVKKCVPTTMIQGEEGEGGEVSCQIFYVHVGTKEVKNITITDIMPENFTYINGSQITNVSEILDGAGLGNLNLPVNIPLAEGPDNASTFDQCNKTGNVTFGRWNISAQEVPGGLGKLAVGVVGINFTMKAPVRLTNATNTTVNIVGVGEVNAEYQNFTNNVIVNITEIDEVCDESQTHTYTVNETISITVIKLSLSEGGVLLKSCPLPTFAGEEISCTIAYLYIGVKPLKNITITDYLPDGFR